LDRGKTFPEFAIAIEKETKVTIQRQDGKKLKNREAYCFFYSCMTAGGNVK